MPIMDGLEATRRIRANPDWRTVPIIAVSANASKVDQSTCLSAAQRRSCPKRSTLSLLLRAIGDALSLQGRTTAIPESGTACAETRSRCQARVEAMFGGR